MRPDLELPASRDLPLIGGVESLEGPRTSLGREDQRDEAIILLLREKLKERGSGNVSATAPRNAGSKRLPGEEDKYEPQRINRKICWQYDNTARKVPLLRRHYI